MTGPGPGPSYDIMRQVEASTQGGIRRDGGAGRSRSESEGGGGWQGSFEGESKLRGQFSYFIDFNTFCPQIN